MNNQQIAANPQSNMPVMAMPAAQNSGMMGIFADPQTFAGAMQMAQALADSTIIPREFQKNPSNCLIAIEMSARLSMSPMMVMQNLFIINGRPSWSSKWIVAMINNSRKYKTELQYEFGSDPADGGLSCFAWVMDRENHKVVGPKVTMKMAEAEGWVSKNGSKWKTMPQVMIQYRAASFFASKNCPEMTMGLYSREEAEEMDYEDLTGTEGAPDAPTLSADDLKPITQDQRKTLMGMIKRSFGDEASEILRTLLSEVGCETTDGMPMHLYKKMMARVVELTEGGNG